MSTRKLSNVNDLPPRLIAAPSSDGKRIVRVAAGWSCACGEHDIRPEDFVADSVGVKLICRRYHFDALDIDQS